MAKNDKSQLRKLKKRKDCLIKYGEIIITTLEKNRQLIIYFRSSGH